MIRDSLRPFEQCNGGDEIYYCNDAHNIASTSANYLKDVEDEYYGNCSEPSEEIRRIMVHALTQGGYDIESAYYALRLVNFNSVMDAAKVLSSIKQVIFFVVLAFLKIK